MTLKTYINLPKYKREKIDMVLLKIFSRNDFHQVSIDQIAKCAGISHGSIYKYFKNKDDLYLYILKKAFLKRDNFLNEALENQDLDFYEKIHLLISKSILFTFYNPLYMGVLQHFYRNYLNNKYKNIMKRLSSNENIEYINTIIKSLVKEAYQRKEIRTDLDLLIVSEYIINYTKKCIERLSDTNLIHSKEDFFKDIDIKINLSIELLRNGIENKVNFFMNQVTK